MSNKSYELLFHYINEGTYPKVTIFLLFSTAGKPLTTATTTASESKAWHCRSSDFGKISLMVPCVKARGELCLLPDWELPGEPTEKKRDSQKEAKQKLFSLHFRIAHYINIFKLQENSNQLKNLSVFLMPNI